ncbi:MAG TPA: AAA family ATPase [Candidatus Baltobacteraceae bacterium]|nr:AAA family ATPase [Candidatus Baltobacteraceae bacterium]
MYTAFFRLSEPPFSLSPDPRFLYMSERHREGLAHLVFGVRQPGGFVQLTGEVGSGKTTLCRCLVKQLPPETDIALILNPRLTVLELLATICDELHVPYQGEAQSVKVLVDALNQRLLASHAQGRRTVLVIDEAQNLRADVLEQIRLLTNLETSSEKLLQIILLGQPELLKMLQRPRLRQLAQRITARYHLLPLSRRATYAYIQHRLAVAGRSDPVFTAGALRAVYRLSRGIPRLINIICDRALLGAYAQDRHRIGASIVRRASRETRGIAPWYRRLSLPWTSACLAAALLTAGTAAFLAPGNIPKPGKPDPGVAVPTEVPAAPAVAAAVPVQALEAKASPAPPTPSDPPVSVERLLADPALGGDSAFAALFARWGAPVSSAAARQGCDAGQAYGLACLYKVGTWDRVRRFDLPAVLELRAPGGERQRVALVGLDQDRATLAVGGQEIQVPIAEVARVWQGEFILLWKPPFPSRLLVPGMRGKDVVWVRQTLDTLNGKPGTETSDLYDDRLRQRVMAFQQTHALSPDAAIGDETLVRLVQAASRGSAPSLSQRP